MALGEGAHEGGGLVGGLDCLEAPGERGAADFFRVQMDADGVAKAEWGGEIDVERDDRPGGGGVLNWDAVGLEEAVNGFLDDHGQAREVGDSGGICVGKGDAAFERGEWQIGHGVG